MSRDFVPFALERMMSEWENAVDFNLSVSGVNPLTIEELVEDPKRIADLLSTGLGYPQSNGIIELREKVANLYPGATPDNIIITTGAAQANFTTIWTLMESNNEILVMLPNYMQIWGIAQNFGLSLKTFSLKEELGWAIDIEGFDQAVTVQTKLIAVCNPNSPSGQIMSSEEMEAVVSAANRSGAWLLADEVYAGTERTNEEVTPSFWGSYDRVIVVSSMSKAYGLPGLRIGWAVAPAEIIEQIWARQEYITISSTILANVLAAHALSPEVRPRIIARTRDYIQQGYGIFERWAEQHGELLSWVPPKAGAFACVRYHADANSTELCERLIRDHSTYVVPGDHFGMDGYLRIGFGAPADTLLEGLNRVAKVIQSVR
ncbi:MAG: aminotransferase class I/II-fold pyridoxal phosphate-dependent enzyme [Anaerolineales bacterium]